MSEGDMFSGVLGESNGCERNPVRLVRVWTFWFGSRDECVVVSNRVICNGWGVLGSAGWLC